MSIICTFVLRIGSLLWFCQVGKAKQDGKNKDVQIKSMEETIQSLEMKNRAKDLINKTLQDKVYSLFYLFSTLPCKLLTQYSICYIFYLVGVENTCLLCSSG